MWRNHLPFSKRSAPMKNESKTCLSFWTIFLPSSSSCFHSIFVIISIWHWKIFCIGAEEFGENTLSVMSFHVFVCVPIHESIHQCWVGVNINVEIYDQFLKREKGCMYLTLVISITNTTKCLSGHEYQCRNLRSISEKRKEMHVLDFCHVNRQYLHVPERTNIILEICNQFPKEYFSNCCLQ